MSATLLGEIIERRQSTARVLTSPQGNTRTAREYLRYFRVRTSSKLDGPATVGSATGLPELYDSYDTGIEVDDTASVISIEPREEDRCIWTVEVRYSTETGDEAKSADNPLSRPTEISFSSQKYTRPLTKDRNGKAVVNSAGEAFDPPIEIDDSRPLLTFTRNEGGFDTSLPSTYQDVVNSDDFFGYPALTVKCNRISAVSVFESGFSYWKVTYEFEVRWDTWWINVLDQGTVYLDQNSIFGVPISSNYQVGIFDKNGARVSKAVPLNGAGKPLLPTNPVLTGATSTLVGGIDANALDLDVAALTGFGTAPFTVKIGSEEIYVGVTSGTTTMQSLIRGYNGTSAASHVNGVVVQQMPVYLTFQGYRELPFAPLALP